MFLHDKSSFCELLRPRESSSAILQWKKTMMVHSTTPKLARGRSLAALQVSSGSLFCSPADCLDKYGSSKPFFNATSRLCQQAPPSLSGTPSASFGAPPPSATPSLSRLPNGTHWPTPSASSSAAAGSIVCVHGTVICAESGAVPCICSCDQGWTSELPTDGSSLVIPIQCNKSLLPDSGGQSAGGATACHNDFECFFVDRLPYALVSATATAIATEACIIGAYSVAVFDDTAEIAPPYIIHLLSLYLLAGHHRRSHAGAADCAVVRPPLLLPAVGPHRNLLLPVPAQALLRRVQQLLRRRAQSQEGKEGSEEEGPQTQQVQRKEAKACIGRLRRL